MKTLIYVTQVVCDADHIQYSVSFLQKSNSQKVAHHKNILNSSKCHYVFRMQKGKQNLQSPMAVLG